MTSAILSGGENSRFPAPKGFIEVEGRRLIERNLKILREATDEVVISTNDPELYFYLGVPLIGDVIGPSGPMSGIYSVLLCTGAPEVFVTACDMPFIKPELISYIIGKSAGDATVPVFRGRPEPLLAVYSRGIMKTLENRIKQGRTSLSLLDEVNVRYIEEGDVRKIDPEGKSFININTPEDYERVFKKPLTVKGGNPCLV